VETQNLLSDVKLKIERANYD